MKCFTKSISSSIKLLVSENEDSSTYMFLFTFTQMSYVRLLEIVWPKKKGKNTRIWHYYLFRQPLIKSYIYYDNKSLAGNNENISARHGWKIHPAVVFDYIEMQTLV